MSLLNKIPSIKFRNERITGALIALINLFFAARLVWVLFTSSPERKTFLLLGLAILIQLAFVIAGILPKANQIAHRLLHLTGSPFILYFVFIISKRFIKPILENESILIQTELGTWFYAVFLFLTLIIIVNFVRDLTSRALETITQTKQDDPKSRFVEISQYLIILILIVYWVYTQFINPLPIFSNYDPEFTYMMNSLTPFKDFELYVRMDHPGTFLQIAGSLIALLLSPVSVIKDAYPFVYHINHPEAFLYTARFLILLLNISTIRLIYKVFRNPDTWISSLTGAGMMLVYFATHKDAFAFLTNWSPNAFSFAVGTYFMIILFVIITSGKYRELRTLWMISLAIGLAGTFHIYLVTLMFSGVVIVFFASLLEKNKWMETIKFTGLSILGSITGYITGTLIILRYYESFLRWVLNVATHQGSYGGGSLGFVSLVNLFNNLGKLWRNNPSLFLFWFITLVVIVTIFFNQKRDNSSRASVWAFLIGINLQIAVLLVLFGKHPGHRYLLSISALFPLILISISALIDKQSRLISLLSIAVLSGLSVLFITQLRQSLISHHERIIYFDDYQLEVEEFKVNQASESGYDPEFVTYYWTYNTWSPCYSRWLGNEFSKTRFTEEVSALCPQDRQFDIWKSPVTNLEKFQDPNELNIIIVNTRNFDQVGDKEFITKINSNVQNLGYILVE